MSQIFEYFANAPVQLTAAWVAAGLLALFLVLRKPRRLTLSSGKEGRLEISQHALHRLLETCCEQVTGVVWARARVTRRGGKLETKLRLKVRPDAKLDAIRGYLIQEITDLYRQNLGILAVGAIRIEVVGIISAQRQF